MKIGITERGDIVFDNSWISKISNMDAIILISKGIPSYDSIHYILDNSHKIIYHATTTGYGGLPLEPNVLNYIDRLYELDKFCLLGFPRSQVVIRIDPIIPTLEGIVIAKRVIDLANQYGFTRFRYSIIDLYPHVIKRMIDNSIEVPNSNNYRIDILRSMIYQYKLKGLRFESCAELDDNRVGCISNYDLSILGIKKELSGSSNQRPNCLCPSCKTELLTKGKCPCPYGCIYCYWR